jgi:hypothetical protein
MERPDKHTLSFFGAFLCLACLIGGTILSGALAVRVAGAVKNELVGIFVGFVILGAGLVGSWCLVGLTDC